MKHVYYGTSIEGYLISKTQTHTNTHRKRSSSFVKHVYYGTSIEGYLISKTQTHTHTKKKTLNLLKLVYLDLYEHINTQFLGKNNIRKKI